MLHRSLLALAFLSIAGMAMGETRFGRPVVKLANPKDFEFVNLEDNRFPVLRKNGISVACITYRESQQYYVEVAVTNESDRPIELAKDFVQFKSNLNIASLDTLAVAAAVQKSAASSGGSQGISTSRSSSMSSGAVTANEAQRGSAQSILEDVARTAQVQAAQLAARLTTFGHEKQALTLEPKGTRFYMFVFEQPDRKKAPFEVAVTAEAATWVFAYKE
jgi:RecA-family ATPase